ncbi:MAG TPA: arsenical pump-driving ATPase [Polyangiaceae bacterium]|nr:arsenical pump-driving ATPase [Polyangiaceae bacterium]
MQLVDAPPRYLFFTGKGGVGKTSVASATALSLARQGKNVLIVSTDPASNLDEVLGTPLGTSPTPIAGASGLSALNLDPEAAAGDYRERVVGPYRGVLPDASVRSIEEQLSGACTVEIAAFDEFAKLLGDAAHTARFEHVVFDTAPTGHTLRLLGLPAAWSTYIEASPGGVSCLGPLAGLGAQRGLYAATRAALRDATQTAIVLVARPEHAALAEAERTRCELCALGIERIHFVLNGVFSATDSADPVARALEARGREALRTLPEGLAHCPRTELPLLSFAPVGREQLEGLLAGRAATPGQAPSAVPRASFPSLDDLVDELACADTGVVFTMGKGGVGKTTLARAIARRLAATGKRVHLTTTDPASERELFGGATPDGVRVSRLDAEVETQAYVAEVLRDTAATLDRAARELVEEELRSPCTQEVAVFRAFARLVGDGTNEFVVIDTAPTGHTLLLLDAAEAFHREVARSAADVPVAVRDLLPRLRDPGFAKVVLVTLPEATPIHEARALQADLVRAGIRPFAWVVNQSLLPLDVTDPVLVARRAAEPRFVAEVQAAAARFVVEPFACGEPLAAPRRESDREPQRRLEAVAR